MHLGGLNDDQVRARGCSENSFVRNLYGFVWHEDVCDILTGSLIIRKRLLSCYHGNCISCTDNKRETTIFVILKAEKTRVLDWKNRENTVIATQVKGKVYTREHKQTNPINNTHLISIHWIFNVKQKNMSRLCLVKYISILWYNDHV